MARKPDQIAKYLEARSLGMFPVQAAVHAQYSEPAKAARRLETENPSVIAFVAELNEANREAAKITREKVIEGVLEAIQVGKLQDDAQAMIRGFSELNKMCGFYEPEKREVLHLTGNAQQRLKVLEATPTEKLLELIGGDMTPEVEVIEHDPD